jgi:hypothetical protein
MLLCGNKKHKTAKSYSDMELSVLILCKQNAFEKKSSISRYLKIILSSRYLNLKQGINLTITSQSE